MFGLNPLQSNIAVAIGSAAIAVALMWNPVYMRGYDAAAAKANILIADAKADRASAETDLAACQSTNGNYLKAVQDQVAEVNRRLIESDQARALAQEKNALSDRRMMDAAAKVTENSELAREAIRNALDKCVRANVPANFIGVLNGILPPDTASAGDGPGGVP